MKKVCGFFPVGSACEISVVSSIEPLDVDVDSSVRVFNRIEHEMSRGVLPPDMLVVGSDDWRCVLVQFVHDNASGKKVTTRKNYKPCRGLIAFGGITLAGRTCGG